MAMGYFVEERQRSSPGGKIGRKPLRAARGLIPDGSGTAVDGVATPVMSAQRSF